MLSGKNSPKDRLTGRGELKVQHFTLLGNKISILGAATLAKIACIHTMTAILISQSGQNLNGCVRFKKRKWAAHIQWQLEHA